jgi:hypothetical protein
VKIGKFFKLESINHGEGLVQNIQVGEKITIHVLESNLALFS